MKVSCVARKSVPLLYLALALLCGGGAAHAQGTTKCFSSDWLQGRRLVNLRVDGGRVAGTFTVEGDGGDRGAATYEFKGSLRGSTLNVAFAGGRLPDLSPSEMVSLAWTLARDGGREVLRIKVRGKNYETGRYADGLVVFEPCEGGDSESPARPATGNVSAPEDAIPVIRRRYAAINRGLSKYRGVKKRLSGFSTEGGELVAHLDGDSVAKLTATLYGETGRSLEEFYYWDGELIFVFRKRYTYDAPLSGKVSGTAEDRFYFNDGALIRWVDERGRNVAPGGGEYLEAQAHYLDSSRRFLEAARSQDPSFEAPRR